jgi:putative spermidine/putrescine transport system substrate-binding protein
MTKRLRSSDAAQQASRRDVLRGSGAVALGVVLGPLVLTPGKAKASTLIRFADDGGGANAEARKAVYLDPFSKKTGIEVKVYVGQRNLAKVKAMMQTGNLEYDMSADQAVVAAAADNEGYLEKLDKSKLDLTRHMFPQWVYDTRIAYQFYCQGLAYNKENLAGKPVASNWKEYWDVENFPGRRAFLVRAPETMEAALMADGVAPKDMYPLDIDRAFKSLDKMKPHIQVWYEDIAKSIELLQTKETDYAHTSSPRTIAAQKAGVPLDFIWTSVIAGDAELFILKGAENYDACMQLVGFFLTDSDAGVDFLKRLPGNGPVDSEVLAKLPADLKAKLPDPKDPNRVWLDSSYWAANTAPVVERLRLWLLS